MKLLEAFRANFSIGLKGLTVQRGSSIGIASASQLLPSEMAPWENTAVASCLSSAIDAFPEARLVVQKFDGKLWNEVPGHPAAELMASPNPFYDGDVLLQGYILSQAIDGNGYFLPVRNSFGTIQEIWYEPHFAIWPVCSPWESEKFISHYERQCQGKVERLAVHDVIHDRWGIDPQDPRKGLSPFKQARRAVGADNEGDQYAYSVLRKKGVVGLSVSPTGDREFSLDEAQLLANRIDREYTGEGRGKTFVSTIGVEITTPGAAPKDMAFGEFGRRSESRIAGIMNTPAIIAGLEVGLERSTFANMEEAQKYYTYRFLVPRWRKLASTLTHQLLPNFFPLDRDGLKLHRFHFDTSAVVALQENRNETEGRARENWLADGITHNEFREIIGKDPDTTRGEMYYSQLVSGTPEQAAMKKLKSQLRSRMTSSRETYEALQLDNSE